MEKTERDKQLDELLERERQRQAVQSDQDLLERREKDRLLDQLLEREQKRKEKQKEREILRKLEESRDRLKPPIKRELDRRERKKVTEISPRLTKPSRNFQSHSSDQPSKHASPTYAKPWLKNMGKKPELVQLKDLSDQDLLEQVKSRLNSNKDIEKQIKQFLFTEKNIHV